MAIITANLTSDIPADLSKQITELVTSYEIAVDGMLAREQAMEQLMQLNEKFLNEQIDKINVLLDEFNEVMNEASAARWRTTADAMLRQGKDHSRLLQDACEDIKKSIKESTDKFDRVTVGTVKTVNEAMGAFRISDIKELVDASAEQIKEIAVGAIDRVYKVIRWFHWKNILMALGVSLLIAIVMGLYINDEWPWEMHSSVVQQRTAGLALINAWSHLSPADQENLAQQIIKSSQ